MNSLGIMATKLIRGLADFSPSCKTAARLQSESRDHKLTLRQQLGLRIHLLLCKWCRRYGKQVNFLGDAARSQPEVTSEAAAQQLSAEAKIRMQQKLRANVK